MLRALTIRDFVIVDRLDLEFAPGFTVLTGETGAGKSILIDALSLCFGERAESTLLRPGAERAEIAAEFDLAQQAGALAWLRARELADETRCLLRRLIDAGGRSRAFVNGAPVTLAQLRELADQLIDIHGQHEHQSLSRAAAQRELLDAFGGNQPLVAQVRATYERGQAAQRARVQFESNAAAFTAEKIALEDQVRELAALDVTPAAWEELQSEHKRLANAAELIAGVDAALGALADEDGATVQALAAINLRLRRLREFDSALAPIVELADSAQVQLQEAAQQLRRYRDRLDLDPQRLQDVEARLAQAHQAGRKYRVSVDQLPALLVQARARLNDLAQVGSADELRRSENAARAAYLEVARKLSGARAAGGKRLSAAVSETMQMLAMQGGRFEVQLTALPDADQGNAGGANGLETIEFQVSAHSAQPLGPIARVASGGELSRLSLAIQVVLADVEAVQTLIFDEVDAGIGGRVAEIVGRLLKQLGRNRQVMCVTHLPQVAVCGDTHLRVTKAERRGAVLSEVAYLDAPARIEEIARMLGGVKITDTTRQHAAELIAATRAKPNARRGKRA